MGPSVIKTLRKVNILFNYVPYMNLMCLSNSVKDKWLQSLAPLSGDQIDDHFSTQSTGFNNIKTQNNVFRLLYSTFG